MAPRSRVSASAEDLNSIMNENVTYEHRIVYDSFPKVLIESAPGIQLFNIQRAKTDADGTYVDNGDLRDLDDQQYTDDGYIVPMNPVVENRIITLTAFVDEQHVTTGVGSLELPSGVRITVDHYTVNVEGADDDTEVSVVDMKGRTVIQTTQKTFQLNERGLYLIKVGKETLKALVR